MTRLEVVLPMARSTRMACLETAVHGAEQRGLLVQGLAVVGTEGGGDAEGHITGGVFLQEGGGGAVPGGVAAGLEGHAQAAAGEGGGIRLALDQLLAGKLHDHAAVVGGGDEGVVLLGGDAGQRLEPVGVVGGTFFDGPILHGVGHHRGHLGGKGNAGDDGLPQGLVGLLGQPLLHDLVIKDIGPEQLGHGDSILTITAITTAIWIITHSLFLLNFLNHVF